LVGLAIASLPASAQHYSYQQDGEYFTRGWWLSAGLGGGSVNSQAPAPSAQRDAFTASVDVGYHISPRWGLGLDAGIVVPGGDCARWECAASPAEFAPNFTHLRVFGEYRPRNSGWRLRAGVGSSRFCYRSYWSDSGWNWVDTIDVVLQLLNDDYISNDTIDGGSGAYRCDAKKGALGVALSAGYDWPVAGPMSMGVRLTAEGANFRATPSIGLPAFRHRAVLLSLHLNLN
jgi:hypothetical protein